MSIPSGNGLPPSPPNSTEGELCLEKIESNPAYPPVPVYGHGSSDGMDYMKLPYHNTVHQDPSAMGMPGPQVNTPPTTVDDESIQGRVQSHSPVWTSPRRHAPTPKAKLSKSPRERRRTAQRDPTKNSRSVPITGPLSEITKHMTDIPLKDMSTYVIRSKEERLKEARDKGKVPRPMNSFMLYRSSYAPRIKVFIGQTNHQEVSRAAGCGWKMEPIEIREMYEEFARTERDNHAATHPEYKFKPQKGPATTKVVGELTPPLSIGLGMDSGSPGHWEDHELSLLGMHSRSRSFDVEHLSRTSSPFDYTEPPSSSYINSWGSPHPGTNMPTVHPSALHNSMGSQVEDVSFRRTPAPSEMQYGITSSLTGLPGGTHHDLLQPPSTQSLHPPINETANLDPQMLSYDSMSAGIAVSMGDPYNTTPSPFPIWPGETNCYLPSTGAVSSSAEYNVPIGATYLPNLQRNPSWDATQHDNNEITEADWADGGASNLWKVEEV
ncbi:hypothetical protein N7470_000120 [Penicillium chermesinum]|nr:hypothetical protein N7470_000120 [Penicillium chermesinum]